MYLCNVQKSKVYSICQGKALHVIMYLSAARGECTDHRCVPLQAYYSTSMEQPPTTISTISGFAIGAASFNVLSQLRVNCALQSRDPVYP